MVLAGGEGKRLAPLTADRAKPAVPFGGNYRLIDFALSNLVNAGSDRLWRSKVPLAARRNVRFARAGSSTSASSSGRSPGDSTLIDADDEI